MLLAETVSIDGGLLLVLLAIAFGLVAAWCALVAAGFHLARRVARGDQTAMSWWIAVGVLQVLLPAVTVLPFALVSVVLVGVQWWLIARGRRDTDGAPGE